MATDPQDIARQAELRDLRAVAAGDQGVFSRLVAAHGPVLLRFARSLLADAAEAEDLVQETLIKLWEAAGTWRPEARLSAWLHRVCYNGAMDRLRARRAFADPSTLDELPDAAPRADAAILEAEVAAGLWAAIEALPHRQRTALMLFHFQDLPQADCAAVMAVSEEALESLLARARRSLRLSLSDPGGGTDDDHA